MIFQIPYASFETKFSYENHLLVRRLHCFGVIQGHAGYHSCLMGFEGHIPQGGTDSVWQV